jgi:hypothetical protein
MTAQILPNLVISDELMEALKELTMEQSRQVLNFARFLMQENLNEERQSGLERGDVSSESCSIGFLVALKMTQNLKRF